MKKIVSLSLCLFLAIGMASVFAGGGGESAGGGTNLMRLAHGAPTEHSCHVALEKFKEIVEAGSSGSIKVELYPNQQMGGDREIVEGSQFGNITGGTPSTTPVAAFLKEFFILDAPFNFSTRDQVFKALDGEPGVKLLTYLEKINLKGLGYAENGFRNLTCNRLIRSPDDLRGVKIRVMENEIQILTWSSLNANPTPMAFGEVFTALQQKTVDAQENPFELIYTNKFFEAQSHLMLTSTSILPLFSL